MAEASPILLWFRKDLRLNDHAALHAAVQEGRPVLPVYIHDPEDSLGGASKAWLHRSLKALDSDLKELGARLILQKGPTRQVLETLCRETKASGVFVSKRYEPRMNHSDRFLAGQLKHLGIDWKAFEGHLLWEPDAIRNKSGKPFQVFTPFWKSVSQGFPAHRTLPRPQQWPTPAKWPKSDALGSLDLTPGIAWDTGFWKAWTPGEQGARDRLQHFAEHLFSGYGTHRDFPGEDGTSRLSPHLHFGEITPGQIAARLLDRAEVLKMSQTEILQSTYLREIGWREFAHHLLHHFPQTTESPLRPEFEHFPWREDASMLRAWQRGRTGYPIVDAGMRELWTTGWMHNRVRMIVGSFLVKHLLLHWKQGAAWFWDTLVDADLANNTLGWQWIGGCGADAAPYFRVFNPVTQSQKFAGDGTYLRRWVPEIARLPDEALYAPWEVDTATLKRAGICLGETYPEPMVNHHIARQVALDAYQRMKGK